MRRIGAMRKMAPFGSGRPAGRARRELNGKAEDDVDGEPKT